MYLGNNYKHILLRNIYYSSIKYLSESNITNYKKCYTILGVPHHSDQSQVREAFLNLAKRYHPDSGGEEANKEKFHEIEYAFRLLQDKFSKERWGVDEKGNEEAPELRQFNKKHNAPQHRNYLSYEGVGHGTIFEREKQYASNRAQKAAATIVEYQTQKILNEGTKEDAIIARQKHDVKTKAGIDRLVEDLIQEAMSKGEFNDLKGIGKPLPSHNQNNPYVDFTTQKLNQVLIENGFMPEWVTLRKEITEDINNFRNMLKAERLYIDPIPLSSSEDKKWQEIIMKYQETYVKPLNEKINLYNLMVPLLQQQIVGIKMDKEAQKILETGLDNTKVDTKEIRREKYHQDEEPTGLFGFIYSLVHAKS